MTDLKRPKLKAGYVYRVVGRSLQLGKAARSDERFEGLRYVGTMVPYQNGFADVHAQTEVFYWFAKRHYVLFKLGSFQAEEMLT